MADLHTLIAKNASEMVTSLASVMRVAREALKQGSVVGDNSD